MKAIIIGGGIGGLTAAIALERCGIRAEVYERAPELREVGAGITLWANALNALETIGIPRDELGPGPSGSHGVLRDSDGAVITTSSYDGLTRRYGAALIAVHRANLLAALGSKIRSDGLKLDHDCREVSQTPDRVEARFANGATAAGDVLIGADGLRSVVRATLFGDTPPRYAGYTAWRSVVHAPDELMASESWGPGQRFGIVPLGDGRVYWFATHDEREGGSDAAERGARQRLLRLFKGWHAPIEKLIAAADDTSIIRGDIYDRDPLSRWSVGRITLLGDAAHPTTPNLGQGACQAIEDALELAVSLAVAESSNISNALQKYEARRMARTRKVVAQSRRIGELGQWSNPFVRGIRNGLLRLLPSDATERQLEWVVGYRGLTPEEEQLFSRSSRTR